jgi:hypothetical protein
MKVQAHVQGKDWSVNVPDTFIERCVAYAISVIGQRATAGMGENTDDERIAAVRDRYARIERGEWSEGGGRAADPIAREMAAILRTAAIRNKAAKAYKADDVPNASAGVPTLMDFATERFTKAAAEKIRAKAKQVAAAREGDVL